MEAAVFLRPGHCGSPVHSPDDCGWLFFRWHFLIVSPSYRTLTAGSGAGAQRAKPGTRSQFPPHYPTLIKRSRGAETCVRVPVVSLPGSLGSSTLPQNAAQRFQRSLQSRLQPAARKPCLQSRLQPAARKPCLQSRLQPAARKPCLQSRLQPVARKPFCPSTTFIAPEPIIYPVPSK